MSAESNVFTPFGHGGECLPENYSVTGHRRKDIPPGSVYITFVKSGDLSVIYTGLAR